MLVKGSTDKRKKNKKSSNKHELLDAFHRDHRYQNN